MRSLDLFSGVNQMWGQFLCDIQELEFFNSKFAVVDFDPLENAVCVVHNVL